MIGAQREGRTPTPLREPDFESGASASSAIRAHLSLSQDTTERISSMPPAEGQSARPLFFKETGLLECLHLFTPS